MLENVKKEITDNFVKIDKVMKERPELKFRAKRIKDHLALELYHEVVELENKEKAD